jgi:hypothetical protein
LNLSSDTKQGRVKDESKRFMLKHGIGSAAAGGLIGVLGTSVYERRGLDVSNQPPQSQGSVELPYTLVWVDNSGKSHALSSHGELLVSSNIITAYGASVNAGKEGASTTTCSIQEAINSLRYNSSSESQGGLVKIKGVLNLPANTPGITLYPGIGLEGEGPLGAFQTGTSIINVPSQLSVPAITVEIDSNSTSENTFPYIANLAISGGGGAQPGQHGISVTGANGTINDFFVFHCLIYRMGGNGVNIYNPGKHYFNDCYMEDNAGIGVNVIDNTFCKISRCYIFGNQGHGIYFNSTSGGLGYRVVDNCEIYGNYLDGIRASPGRTSDEVLQILNNRFINNGFSPGYSNLSIWYQPSFEVVGNSFEDNRTTLETSYHINLNDSRSAGLIALNLFRTGALSGYFNWNCDGHLISIFENIGYNPVGIISSPFSTSAGIIGMAAKEANPGSSPSASTEYVVGGGDILVTSQGGSSVSITIQDSNGHVLNSGVIALTRALLKRGSKISWGAFTGDAPTVTVEGV